MNQIEKTELAIRRIDAFGKACEASLPTWRQEAQAIIARRLAKATGLPITNRLMASAGFVVICGASVEEAARLMNEGGEDRLFRDLASGDLGVLDYLPE